MKKNIGKEELLNSITEEAEKAVAKNTTTLSIYYSGHGREEDGAWKTSKKGGLGFDKSEYFIELHDIINAITKSGYEQNLEITSDSCYSGKLCFKAA